MKADFKGLLLFLKVVRVLNRHIVFVRSSDAGVPAVRICFALKEFTDIVNHVFSLLKISISHTAAIMRRRSFI